MNLCAESVDPLLYLYDTEMGKTENSEDDRKLNYFRACFGDL